MNKKIMFLLFLVLVFNRVCAQENRPISKGIVVITTGQKIEFSNLRYEGDEVVFKNLATQTEFRYFKTAIKKIIDTSAMSESEVAQLPEKEPRTIPEIKKSDEQLVYKSYSAILSKGEKLDKEAVMSLLQGTPNIYENYKEGYARANAGKVLMELGLGFMLGGALNNMMNVYTASGNTSSVGRVLMVSGLLVTIVSIPVKIEGTSKVKEAIQEYNNLPKQVSFFNKTELKVTTGSYGIGFQLRF